MKMSYPTQKGFYSGPSNNPPPYFVPQHRTSLPIPPPQQTFAQPVQFRREEKNANRTFTNEPANDKFLIEEMNKDLSKLKQQLKNIIHKGDDGHQQQTNNFKNTQEPREEHLRHNLSAENIRNRRKLDNEETFQVAFKPPIKNVTRFEPVFPQTTSNRMEIQGFQSNQLGKNQKNTHDLNFMISPKKNTNISNSDRYNFNGVEKQNMKAQNLGGNISISKQDTYSMAAKGTSFESQGREKETPKINPLPVQEKKYEEYIFKTESKFLPAEKYQVEETSYKNDYLHNFDTLAQEKQRNSKYQPYHVEEKPAYEVESKKKSSFEHQRKKSDLQMERQSKIIEERLESLRFRVNWLEKQNSQLQNQIMEEKRKTEKGREENEEKMKEFKLSFSFQKEFEAQEQKYLEIIEKVQSQNRSLKEKQTQMSKNAFDQVLKTQLQDLKKFKLQIGDKSDEIDKLKQQISGLHKKILESENELKIKQLQYNSLLKQQEKKTEIQVLDKSNEIQSLKRSLETLESKFKIVMKEVEEKDGFISTFLVGRAKESSDQDYIRGILAQYQIAFPTCRVMDTLLQEQKEIENLKKEVQKLTWRLDIRTK